MTSDASAPLPAPSAQTRLLSLDAFRGATIAGMILVNNAGNWNAVYEQLEHSKWNGWTFTDWIFPFFLYIVGVALVFSFAKRKDSGLGKSELYKQVFKRSLKIFGLGLFLNGFPFGLLFGHHFDLGTWRIAGVLQRIAVCYLAVSFIYLNTDLRAQLRIIVGLLIGYWALLKLVPVPGFGAGVLLPMGNLEWFIDSHVLGSHSYGGSPAKGFDPEGILSSLGAIATCMCGLLAGQWLRSRRSPEEKTAWMFAAGNLLLLLSVLFDMVLPINKNLWTSSYVVMMAGWASICFAMFYWLIDVKGITGWARPFIVFGMNAIAVYVAAGVIGRSLSLIKITRPDGTLVSTKIYIYEHVFAPLAAPHNASLGFALSFVSLNYFIAWGMWRKKWFLKV